MLFTFQNLQKVVRKREVEVQLFDSFSIKGHNEPFSLLYSNLPQWDVNLSYKFEVFVHYWGPLENTY